MVGEVTGGAVKVGWGCQGWLTGAVINSWDKRQGLSGVAGEYSRRLGRSLGGWFAMSGLMGLSETSGAVRDGCGSQR